MKYNKNKKVLDKYLNNLDLFRKAILKRIKNDNEFYYGYDYYDEKMVVTKYFPQYDMLLINFQIVSTREDSNYHTSEDLEENLISMQDFMNFCRNRKFDSEYVEENFDETLEHIFIDSIENK